MAEKNFGNGPFRHFPWILCLSVLLYLLLANAFNFAALGDHPRIGKHFRAAVADDAPIVASYLLAGDLLRKLLPTAGDQTAQSAAAPLEERIRGYPPAAVAVFFGDSRSPQQSRMQWQHRFAPVFVVLTLIAWLRRPKNVHLVRQTRHR